KTLPDVFGASEPRENAADLRTRGFEITVNWNDEFTLGNRPFNYSIGGVLADYTAEITRFDNPNKLLSIITRDKNWAIYGVIPMTGSLKPLLKRRNMRLS